MSAGLPGECGINTNHWILWGKTFLGLVCHIISALSIVSSDKTMKSWLINMFFRSWTWGHGNPFHSWCHYIQKSIYRAACRKSWKWWKLPSRVSWHCNFKCVYRLLREKKKKERNLWRLGRLSHMSVHWRRTSSSLEHGFGVKQALVD